MIISHINSRRRRESVRLIYVWATSEAEFSFLSLKPGAGEGKRTKGKRCGSLVARGVPEVFIAKEIYDPGKVLGKYSSISTMPREKQRGSRARRDIATRRAADGEQRNGCRLDEEAKNTKLRYILIHEKPVYYGRYMRSRAYPKLRRARVKYPEMDDMEQSEQEENIHFEDDDPTVT
ncbi:hypothetical protein Y032_0757g2103 [Ancylostoma ceylanicum]|uniref:Uncharacterized protein n=1 Tax=Ancylostoma ceylanicum TaxID=53326 RepID=A0A016WE83_9BILA|nr:hypothetical protein Y032_0757g2103 [Ancylostoma ceylanicum]